jgi:hypothetical protein
MEVEGLLARHGISLVWLVRRDPEIPRLGSFEKRGGSDQGEDVTRLGMGFFERGNMLCLNVFDGN